MPEFMARAYNKIISGFLPFGLRTNGHELIRTLPMIDCTFFYHSSAHNSEPSMSLCAID